MATYGFNFRATSGYVTDGSRQIFVDSSAGHDYPHTYDFGGGDTVTAGWTDRGGGYPQTRDRNSSVDARCAGMHYTDNGSSGLIRNFRIDLPGSNTIVLAAGDHDNAQDSGYISIRDSAGEKFNINHATGFTTAAAEFRDATDVLRTSVANWVSANAASASYTFTDYVLLRIGSASGTGISPIAHLAVVQGSTTKPAYAYAQQQ